jgi:hypothetical protein
MTEAEIPERDPREILMNAYLHLRPEYHSVDDLITSPALTLLKNGISPNVVRMFIEGKLDAMFIWKNAKVLSLNGIKNSTNRERRQEVERLS